MIKSGRKNGKYKRGNNKKIIYDKIQTRFSSFEEKEDKKEEEKKIIDVEDGDVEDDKEEDEFYLNEGGNDNSHVINIEKNIEKVEIKIIDGVKCSWCGKEVEKRYAKYWHTGALVCVSCWDGADQQYKSMMEELRQEIEKGCGCGLGGFGYLGVVFDGVLNGNVNKNIEGFEGYHEK